MTCTSRIFGPWKHIVQSVLLAIPSLPAVLPPADLVESAFALPRLPAGRLAGTRGSVNAAGRSGAHFNSLPARAPQSWPTVFGGGARAHLPVPLPALPHAVASHLPSFIGRRNPLLVVTLRATHRSSSATRIASMISRQPRHVPAKPEQQLFHSALICGSAT